MNDRCARFVYLLALLPLICTAWMVVVIYTDSEHAAGIATTIFGMCFIAWVWRKYVRWTVLRSFSTLGLTGAVLLQVIWWQPLFGVSSCVADELRTAQSLGSWGLWIAGSGVLWWGSVLVGRQRPNDLSGLWRLTMSRDAARLVVALALVPILPGLFWVLYFFLEDNSVLPSWAERVWLSYTLCALLAVVVWVLLWWRSIPRSVRGIGLTAVLAALLVLSPLGIFVAERGVLGMVFDGALEVFFYLAPLFAWALWLAGTARLWRVERGGMVVAQRDDAGDVFAEVVCQQCGYSLRGLREVRCPECGWASTVDQIVTATLRAAPDDA